MTEDEAANKMCPLLPIAYAPNGTPVVTVAGNTFSQQMSGGTVPARQFNCVGSKCMMWIEREYKSGCGLVHPGWRS